MASKQQQLEAAVLALESQRGLLGDAVVDASLGALRVELAGLKSPNSLEPAQTLKQVTILFLDVVGSTTLSQLLDPEAISDVMDDALKRATALVAKHQGKVLQYAGDSMLAAFGADEAREDDAERAVHCGLALLALAKLLRAEVLAARGYDGFDVRIGIHTGGVLLGGGVDADGTIRGIAVNIAARMEQTAPAGSLRVSHDTYAQVRGLFEIQAQDPLTVKGVAEPVNSYLITRAKPRSFRIGTRGIEGVATRMIGRDAELEGLQHAFKRLFVKPASERKLAAVTVVAEAGIGKSRLLYEFEAWTDTRPEKFYLFRGRATPQTQGQPYGLLRDIFAWRFQIADDDSVDVARQKMEEGIVPLFIAADGPEIAEGHAHVLGHLIGIEWQSSRHLSGILDDAKQIRNRAFHAAAQLFRRLIASDGNPIVLQLEDLHWADNESLDFLNYLAEVNRDIALLILGFTRPSLFERRRDWTSTEGVHQRIDLAPLDKTGSRLLANELLKKLPEVPAALRELITGGAEGNPFYMEELVKMLIDERAIEVGEAWKVNSDRLLITHVPTTLTGVLQARLDGLPAAEKPTLQKASVIGPVFWDQALVALEARAPEILPSLVGRDLVHPSADAEVDGLREYSFRHHLLHQVVYETVLKRSKRELHAKVAQWLSGYSGLRASDFLAVTAEHYELAGDFANAVEFHARAAEHALQRLGHDAVLMHVDKALALIGETGDPELRWRLLKARELTLAATARRDEQTSDIESMERLAEALQDDGKRAYAAWRCSGLASEMANLALQESAALRSMTWAKRAGDDAVKLHALRLLANARVARGEVNAGKAVLQEGLVEARRLGLRYIEARMLTTLSVAANAKNDALELLDLTRRSLKIFQEIGDRRGETLAVGNLGTAWLDLGDLTEARRYSEQALGMTRANGDRFLEANALCTLSTVALYEGEDARALSLARLALDLSVAVRARSWEANALLTLGDAELALGRHSPAHEAFEQARSVALAIEDVAQHDAAAGLARVALAQGDEAAALHAVQAVLHHVGNGGTLEGTNTRLIEWTLHRVLARAHDPRAAEWLARAHNALQAHAAKLLEPALRYGFLNNIPHHREIVAAWAKRMDAQSSQAASEVENQIPGSRN